MQGTGRHGLMDRSRMEFISTANLQQIPGWMRSPPGPHPAFTPIFYCTQESVPKTAFAHPPIPTCGNYVPSIQSTRPPCQRALSERSLRKATAPHRCLQLLDAGQIQIGKKSFENFRVSLVLQKSVHPAHFFSRFVTDRHLTVGMNKDFKILIEFLDQFGVEAAGRELDRKSVV